MNEETKWRNCATRLYEIMDAAIRRGDWKVDGACDQDLAMIGFLKLNGEAFDEMPLPL
jgi:hypothetical protein